MRSFRKLDLVAVVGIPVVALFATACAPTSRGGAGGGGAGWAPLNNTPAEVTLRRLPNGKIDFVRLKNDLSPWPEAGAHDSHMGGACTGCVVKIDVRQIGKSHDIDPERGPAKFRIIGTFHNTDPAHSESTYNLAPGGKYYVWVNAAAENQARTSKTRWGLLHDHPNADTVGIGYVLRCHESGFDNKISWIDFYPCDHLKREHARPGTASGEGRTSFFASLSKPFKPATARTFRETWFECDPGCCSGTRQTQ